MMLRVFNGIQAVPAVVVVVMLRVVGVVCLVAEVATVVVMVKDHRACGGYLSASGQYSLGSDILNSITLILNSDQKVGVIELR